MPFYEYQCSRCSHHHEELQKVTDKPLRRCPECGASTLHRLISAPVFRLKGGGWYETDFKSEKDGKRNLAGEREPAVAKADDKKDAGKPAPDAKPSVESRPAAAADRSPAAKSAAGESPPRAAPGSKRTVRASGTGQRAARAARPPRARR